MLLPLDFKLKIIPKISKAVIMSPNTPGFLEKSILPFYVKCSVIIVGVVTLFYVLYIGQDILIPLVFATLIAILLNPLVNFFNRKLNCVVSIALCILIATILITGILIFIYSHLKHFTETFPQLKVKLAEFYEQCIGWVGNTFNLEAPKIEQWVSKVKTEGLDGGSAVIGQTLGTVTGGVVVTLLMPVYIFMILYYKPLLLEFINKLFPKQKHSAVEEVLQESKSLIQSYLIGLLVEAAIVAILNCTGLLILGIRYAVLIGILGALLNMIPYIGGIVAIAMPVIVALTTKEPISALLVIVLYMVIQFIDNNLIVPKIVASRVKINALVSIVIVLVGGAMWGVSGMFLSIPLTAILKVIFDRVEPLKPLGYLLGDTMPDIGKTFFSSKKKEPKKQA